MFWVRSFGAPFVHKNLKHVGWVSGIKGNILEAEDITTGMKVVLKVTDEKADYKHELGFLQHLSKTKAREFVVELKGAEEPVEGEQRAALLPRARKARPKLDRLYGRPPRPRRT